MEPSNATQPRNSSHGVTRVTQSGVPCFHVRRYSPPILYLTTYLTAK